MSKRQVETTNYSIKAAPPTQPERRKGERRQGERYLSLLRVGALVIDGRRELCLIRNVSAGGMMIRPYSSIQAGTRIAVELKHGESVTGVAQWCDNGLTGIVFDEKIDVITLLSASDGTPKPRMPRIELECIASIRQEGEVWHARVVNISQGGIRLESSTPLVLNGDVIVSLPGLHSAAGVVRWKDGNYYGIGFNRSYLVDELMAFLRQQQDDEPRQAVG
ncbi:MAG TPA: PilZ domain-containing protein [Sphingomicrobium sp.]|nr:PilZ domain-containing protein [Sphingomicrobium sp.]